MSTGSNERPATASVFSILLARHPPVEGADGLCYGRSDLPLATGWHDHVASWAALWKGREQGTLYTSPSTRCRRAAQALLASLPDFTSITSDARLLEMDFGSWEGRAWSKIDRGALDEWAADPLGYRPGGGETVTSLIERVTAFWEERVEAAEPCCVITHGGPLRVLLAFAEGRSFRMEDRAPAQGHAVLLHFFNNHGRFVAQIPPIR
ncbi:phosphoglycerate mutase [Asaia sp. W19]|uniref:histidine phosphatase family protein n=1 Tax=unclassified Asaia TaxID=2685023 RepID=UPI000F8D2AE0|nr:histidine phosphatase family protein [Asaia sp. W19]RUT25777.1 phosphoglycerate mutase [Asaia sp. W19]